METLNLPAILRAAAELVDAATSYRPEDHADILAAQADPVEAPEPSFDVVFRWHDALNAIHDAADRLKRALGATGELRPGRVLAEATPAAWRHYDSKFQDLDYVRSVRVGIRRLAFAAVDLSGFAELQQPPEELRQRALAQLGRGVIQVWPALSAGERDEAQLLLPTFRQSFGWPEAADGTPPAWSGPVEIAAAEEGRIVDRSCYCARTNDQLNALAQPPAHRVTETDNDSEKTPATETPKPASVQPRPKKSTARGEGRIKLIAALSQYHGYDNGGVSTTEPINNNELARRANVDKSTASAFFGKHFGGYEKYRDHYCKQQAVLAAALKHLNGEYTTDELFGGEPPSERDRDEE